jgi:hypothetical protein
MVDQAHSTLQGRKDVMAALIVRQPLAPTAAADPTI